MVGSSRYYIILIVHPSGRMSGAPVSSLSLSLSPLVAIVQNKYVGSLSDKHVIWKWDSWPPADAPDHFSASPRPPVPPASVGVTPTVKEMESQGTRYAM